MATHMASHSKDVSGETRNLIDVCTKLAAASDSQKTIRNAHRPDIILPRFTEWSRLSIEQKAKFFDLLVDYHGKSLGNPETDMVQKTGPGFIATAELRKLSGEMSDTLAEGINVLREQTEDVLTFSFTLNVDKLSGFGRNSRDLAECIEYCLPHIYRNKAELHEHSRMFTNAVAATVLEQANLTPFRRGYSSEITKKFKNFTVRSDVRHSYLVDPVALEGAPIIFDTPSILAAPGPVPKTPIPTAVNSPTASQRNSTLQADSSFWSGASEIDYGSEEVQCALDMAEIAAFGQAASVASHTCVAEPDDSASSVETIGTEEASTLDDSTLTSGSTMSESTMAEPFYYQASEHVPHSMGPQPPRVHYAHTSPYGMQATGPQSAFHTGENLPLHFHNPYATLGPSIPSNVQPQPSNIVVPTGYIVLQAPVTPTHRQHAAAVVSPPGTRFAQQNNVGSPTRGAPGPAVSPFGSQAEIRTANSPSRLQGKGKEARTYRKGSESSSRSTKK